MSNRTVLLAALFLLATGCDGITDKQCTLMGPCTDGLIVQVRGTLPDTFTISVWQPAGHIPPWTVQCATVSGGQGPLKTMFREVCMQGLLFENFTPTRARVRVQAQGVDREWDFTPQYRTIYPNGRDCDRVGCRQANVVADLTQ